MARSKASKRLDSFKGHLRIFTRRPNSTVEVDAEAPPGRQPSLRRWIKTKLPELLGADLRSLAVFRIALACLVLMDITTRARSLRALYTDEGALPRNVLLEYLNPWQWTLGLVNGTFGYQAFIFEMTALAAVAMLFGYRTRLMTFIVWVMVFSIQTRNPLVLNAGDNLLRLLLFWGMLLPLGACWSVDSRLRPSRWGSSSMRFLSFGTFGIFMQIAFMYWFTVALKSGPAWREDGTALYFAMSTRQLTRTLGEYLVQFPELLKILTFGTLGVELIAPALLFCPIFTGPVRTFAITAIMSL